jgi:hypothetical protein
MAISQPPFQSTLVDADDRVQTPWAQWFSQLQPVLQSVVATGPTSGRPTQNLFIGYPYFDTTIDQMVYWNGVIWVTYAPSTTGTSILKGNGTGGFNNAIAGTDFAPATSGTAILYGNGAGGFSSVVIGSGITFAAGVLSALGSSGAVTSVSGTGSVNGITLTGTVTSAGSLTLGGSLSGVSLTTQVSGILPIANGGTNTATPALVAGTNVTISGIWPNQTINSTSPTSGTVSSVGFTGGLITVATPTTTPAFTVAGTSGGIPYFSSSSAWATSAELALNSLVIGGGAGAAPATTTTGTGVLTALGANVGAAGAFVTFNGVLGTPSSGTVTNLTGTASININGTVGATTATTGKFTTLEYTSTLTGGTGILNIGSGQLYKDASGNVGIGTTAPSTKLDVAGAITITGAFALQGSYGAGAITSNFAAGDSALASNTTGRYNTASGVDALYSNTTGSNNTASGAQALLSNTTGTNNTASGQSALQSNTTGTNNTASGQSALQSAPQVQVTPQVVRLHFVTTPQVTATQQVV